MSTGTDIKVKDALDHVRSTAQELHGAISDAAAKGGGVTKADLEVFAQKAKAVMESAKSSLGALHEVNKQQVEDAIKQNPLSAVAIAAGLGFLVGAFTRH
jgi:ElaB/YqjD/DUF883 family membrane-anchored ribosome-binding protein